MNRTALSGIEESSSTLSESDFVPPEMQIVSEDTSILTQEEKDTKTDTHINGKSTTLIPAERPFVSYRTNSRFKLLQKFEGTILRVIGDECVAHIRGDEDPDIVEEITFPLAEILYDQHLAVEGAVFNWYIGYEDIAGQRYRKSAIVFRRLPVWRKEDLERAKAEAALILDKLR